MKRRTPDLLLRTGPFLKRGVSTPRLMVDVIIALVPTICTAIWYFGISALLVLLVGTFAAMVAEALFGDRRSLLDGSAALTGLLFALTLPPSLPLWMVCVGSFVAVGLGKAVWGGLGHNMFNPALVGRAFLQAAFPTALTTWSRPGGPAQFFRPQSATLALPLMKGRGRRGQHREPAFTDEVRAPPHKPLGAAAGQRGRLAG